MNLKKIIYTNLGKSVCNMNEIIEIIRGDAINPSANQRRAADKIQLHNTSSSGCELENSKLGPKASCSWGEGKYYKLFTYKGVSFRMPYSLITACPYMRIKSVILIKLSCFTVDRNTRHATATTVNERGMLCAYFIYIKTDING